jgi:alcohol dehydrogenase class IV
MPFSSFNTVSRVVHDAGCIESLPEEIARLGQAGGRVLIVSDPGIAAAGILDRALSVLSGAGLNARVFSEISSDPPMEDARASIAFARDYRPDLVVGIGGGSSLDIAKLTSAMLANPDPIDRYAGMELIEKPGPPLILIPTTAGTGSEVTSICVLSDTANRIKKGIVSRHLFARTVLLDPDLTMGLPPRITAMTGMDALVHAIESYTGIRATPFTDSLNITAIRLIGANLRKAYGNGGDREARKNMLYASCMAGMAFSNTQNALDHALALAIGGRYHLPHGLLTAFICPWVMEFNLVAAPRKYAEIAAALGEDLNGTSAEEAAGLSVRAVSSLLGEFGISPRLSAHGVEKEQFPGIAKSTIGAARLISNNPREVTEEDVLRLLESNY